MDDEMTFTSDEAALADRIKEIDRDLDALEQRAQESVIIGIHSAGAAMTANLGQTATDRRKAALLAERAELVKRLKAEIAGN